MTTRDAPDELIREDAATPPSERRLLELLSQMQGREVLLAVDLVVDRFVLGVPKRISREAPVLILRHDSERFVPGGGANAVANVAALGGRPRPVGIVGDDESGQGLLADLASRGIPTDTILIRHGYATPTKTRVLAGFPHGIKQQVVRLDREEIQPLADEELAQLVAWLAEAAPGADAVVLSDYGYGAVIPDLIPAIRARLRSGVPVLCDSRFRLGEYRGLDGATPNLEEAEQLAGGDLDELAGTLERRGREIARSLGVAFLLVTRGSRGMSLFERAGVAHVPVHGTDQVVDVTGAGDTVIGAFALASAAGASPLEATILANYAGGIVVMKTGTAIVSFAELAHAIRSDPVPRERLRWVSY